MKFISSKTFQLILLLFFLMFAVIIGDNVSETLLLTFYSTEQLSVMFIVNATALFIISLMVIGAIDKLPRFKLFSLIIISQCAGLLSIWVCISLDLKIAFMVLFCFAYVGKILLFLSFWTVANDLCDSREAKSLFPLIGAGGIIGGTIACFSTAYLVKILGPANLLFVWIFLLLMSLMVMLHLSRQNKNELAFVARVPIKKTGFFFQLKEDISLVSQEPLLRSMSILYFIIFFLLISLDFHFFISLKSNLTDFLYAQSHEAGSSVLLNSEDFKASLSKELSSFLGIFRGLANLTTFLIQIGLAGLVLRKLGTVRSMFIMPVIFTSIFFICFLQSRFGLVPDSLPFLPQPFGTSMFLIIILGTAARIAMFDSIFSPNFQIFFSSLPSNIRGRGKMFIEGMAKPLAILLAGGSVLWVGKQILKDSPHLIWIHFLVLFLIGLVLCFIVLLLQRGYTDSISRSLGGNKARQIANVLKMEQWKDTDNIVALLIVQLFDPDDDIKYFSIEILSQLDNDRATRGLERVLEMTAYSERPRIIYSLGKNYKLKDKLDDLESWLWDEDEKVVAAAIDATRYLPYNQIENLIRPYIQHEYPPIATRAISVMWKNGNDLLANEITDRLKQLIAGGKPEDIRLVMETVSELANPALLSILEEASAAMEKTAGAETAHRIFIECLSNFPDKNSIRMVFDFIDDTNESYRRRVFTNLAKQLPLIQENIPDWIQSFNENQKHYLLELLFRQKYKTGRILRKLFSAQLQDSIYNAYFLFGHIKVLEGNNTPEAHLLMHALIEGPLLMTRLKISYLLALAEPSGNLFYTAPRLLSGDKFHRTTATEAIETMFPRELHERITPVFLENNYKKLHKMGEEIWSMDSPDLFQILNFWLDNKLHKWPMTCALFYLISKYPDKVADHHERKFHELLET